MGISNAIVLIAIAGTRRFDGTLLIGGQAHPGFPEQITVEHITFDFAEEEEVDPEIHYWLGHYFRRDEVRPKPDLRVV